MSFYGKWREERQTTLYHMLSIMKVLLRLEIYSLSRLGKREVYDQCKCQSMYFVFFLLLSHAWWNWIVTWEIHPSKYKWLNCWATSPFRNCILKIIHYFSQSLLPWQLLSFVPSRCRTLSFLLCIWCVKYQEGKN